MNQGDFTKLAKSYINRPAYDPILIEALVKIVGACPKIAEVGAGTGKLTKMLLDRGFSVDAVEPNDAMRQEGQMYTKGLDQGRWIKGTGEDTTLQSGLYDWVVMASSFHWTDPSKSLPHFASLLKEGGYFTALWNPRHIASSPLHQDIEDSIYAFLPHLKRVSSGTQNTKDWSKVLTDTKDFKDCIYMQTHHKEHMSKARYMGAWESVNDIQAQAGEQWLEVLELIENKIQHLEIIEVPYLMKSWTVQKV